LRRERGLGWTLRLLASSVAIRRMWCCTCSQLLDCTCCVSCISDTALDETSDLPSV
jgi:hypothetical protein